MRQEIYEDEYGFNAWDRSIRSRCFVHIVNSVQLVHLTGCEPPGRPRTAQDYTAAGLPWFDYYGNDLSALEGAKKLAGLDSVAVTKLKKGEGVPQGQRSGDTGGGEEVEQVDGTKESSRETFYDWNTPNRDGCRLECRGIMKQGKESGTGLRIASGTGEEIRANVSDNTLKAYEHATRKLEDWLDGRTLNDAVLAEYIRFLHTKGNRRRRSICYCLRSSGWLSTMGLTMSPGLSPSAPGLVSAERIDRGAEAGRWAHVG